VFFAGSKLFLYGQPSLTFPQVALMLRDFGVQFTGAL
jgi:hypothetical protein